MSLKWSWLNCFHYETTLIMRHEKFAGMNQQAGGEGDRALDNVE